MKIISKKNKDYYDYVAHIFGRDSNIAYERNMRKLISHDLMNRYKSNNSLSEINNSFILEKDFKYDFDQINLKYGYIDDTLGEFIYLAFCDNLYRIFKCNDGEFIYTKEEFDSKIKLKHSNKFQERMSEKYITEYFTVKENIDININFNSPIVLQYGYNGDIFIDARLEDISFYKLFTPIQCFQEIYNWFSKNKPDPEMPSSPDDMNRYEAKGFDKKTSFRNIK